MMQSSTRKKQRYTTDLIPEDIIDQILLKLPLKSLKRFKCVSRPWCERISDTSFIKAHRLTYCPWISVYNAHKPMKQRYHYNIRATNLLEHVNKGYEDGLYIRCVASAENLWALIMDAGTGFSPQVYELSDVFLNKEWIMEQWQHSFYISSIAGSSDRTSLVVMSKGTPYIQQAYKVDESFPLKWIAKKWKEGFHVTSMATAGNRWGVVMSRDAGYSDQIVELGNKYPNEGTRRRLERRGYVITSMAAIDDRAAFILSMPANKMVDETQETLCTSSFPTYHIKERWSRNACITSICSGRPFADFQL